MLQVKQMLQNRYQLQRQLGSHGSRQTWLALDLQASDADKQQVAIKCLVFNETVNWDDLKLFQREVQVLQNLQHPQIPKYIDDFCIGENSLWYCLVQEYIPGKSLKELLVLGKRFTEIQVKEIAIQVLDILIELHELYPVILHRDIKPSNLICGETGKIYLVDFGAVQDRISREEATFTVVGTYGYTPMEQFSGRAVPASDLYALGASLIHLVTGVSPSDLPQSNLKIQFSDAAKQPLCDKPGTACERISLSPSFTSWLQKMIEPAPENRFATARQAMDALNSGLILQDRDLVISEIKNNSGCGLKNRVEKVPEAIKGWNWGAFLVPWLWLWQNRVWSGLLCFIPIVGFPISIILGIKGNEWAWKSRHWRSIQHFKEYQRSWAIAGILFAAPISILLWISSTILIVNVLLA